MPPSSIAIKPVLWLASLSLFWGLNWPGMKIILSELTVWWFRALCLVVGGTGSGTADPRLEDIQTGTHNLNQRRAAVLGLAILFA